MKHAKIRRIFNISSKGLTSKRSKRSTGEVTIEVEGGSKCDIMNVEAAEVGRNEEAMTTEVISKSRKTTNQKESKEMRDAKERNENDAQFKKYKKYRVKSDGERKMSE